VNPPYTIVESKEAGGPGLHTKSAQELVVVKPLQAPVKQEVVAETHALPIQFIEFTLTGQLVVPGTMAILVLIPVAGSVIKKPKTSLIEHV
jgi:hypothetical protein